MQHHGRDIFDKSTINDKLPDPETFNMLWNGAMALLGCFFAPSMCCNLQDAFSRLIRIVVKTCFCGWCTSCCYFLYLYIAVVRCHTLLCMLFTPTLRAARNASYHSWDVHPIWKSTIIILKERERGERKKNYLKWLPLRNVKGAKASRFGWCCALKQEEVKHTGRPCALCICVQTKRRKESGSPLVFFIQMCDERKFFPCSFEYLTDRT